MSYPYCCNLQQGYPQHRQLQQQQQHHQGVEQHPGNFNYPLHRHATGSDQPIMRMTMTNAGPFKSHHHHYHQHQYHHPTTMITAAETTTTTTIVPHNDDVLMGRGGKNNQHVGNERFRSMARAKAAQYKIADKREKSDISLALVRQVYAKGGRFLERDPISMNWMCVPVVVAREKASQCCRDAVSMKKNNSSIDSNTNTKNANSNSNSNGNKSTVAATGTDKIQATATSVANSTIIEAADSFLDDNHESRIGTFVTLPCLGGVREEEEEDDEDNPKQGKLPSLDNSIKRKVTASPSFSSLHKKRQRRCIPDAVAIDTGSRNSRTEDNNKEASHLPAMPPPAVEEEEEEEAAAAAAAIQMEQDEGKGNHNSDAGECSIISDTFLDEVFADDHHDYDDNGRNSHIYNNPFFLSTSTSTSTATATMMNDGTMRMIPFKLALAGDPTTNSTGTATTTTSTTTIGNPTKFFEDTYDDDDHDCFDDIVFDGDCDSLISDI